MVRFRSAALLLARSVRRWSIITAPPLQSVAICIFRRWTSADPTVQWWSYRRFVSAANFPFLLRGLPLPHRVNLPGFFAASKEQTDLNRHLELILGTVMQKQNKKEHLVFCTFIRCRVKNEGTGIVLERIMLLVLLAQWHRFKTTEKKIRQPQPLCCVLLESFKKECWYLCFIFIRNGMKRHRSSRKPPKEF